MFEKIKSMDTFTKILLVVCGVFMVSSITLGIIAVTRTGNSKNDETPVLTTQVETTETTTETTTTETTTTTTVTTTTTAEETTAETTTTAPAKTAAEAPKKTTAAPVEKPVDEPVKTEAPETSVRKTELDAPSEKANWDPYQKIRMSTEYLARTICDTVNLYHEPEQNKRVDQVLKKGTIVRVYEISDYWCNVIVQDSNETVGFIKKSSLDLLGETNMQDYTNEKDSIRGVVGSYVYMYEKQDYGSNVVTYVPDSAPVKILTCGDNWCLCEYNNLKGYIRVGDIFI